MPSNNRVVKNVTVKDNVVSVNNAALLVVDGLYKVSSYAHKELAQVSIPVYGDHRAGFPKH